MSTITKEFTKERLEEIAEDGFLKHGESKELARIALASLEAEAVHQFIYNNPYEEGYTEWLDCNEDYFNGVPEDCRRILYTAPPAPVSVPDEHYQNLSELYHAQEKRLFKLAQRIKGPSFDKYAHSPSQAIDVLESALFGEHDDECCAAMLQGAENAWSPTTMQTAPALDSSSKISESPSGNSPVIPDGWVMVPAEPTTEMLQSGISAHYERSQIQIHDRPAPGPMECAYLAMLAAAPQQEAE